MNSYTHDIPPDASSERALSRRERVTTFVRMSPWTGILARIFLFASGLLLLAWVGRIATAAPALPVPPAYAGVSRLDAGESPPTASAAPFASTTTPTVAMTPAPAVATPPPSHARATAEDPVYINHADVSELRRLPGVGPKRAEAIVALRQRVGRFQRPEELLRVKGVGRATLRKWRALLRLDAPSAPDAGLP